VTAAPYRHHSQSWRAAAYHARGFRRIPALRQHPHNHGHTLVLPVQHTRNLADASPSVRNEIFAVAAQLTSAVLTLYGAEGSIVFQNNTTPDVPSSTCTCTWCHAS
jgi:diadenosine tetraphosphate (Ap4A) HIT family hydrolase